MQNDVSVMNKAILMYHAENGYYPYSGTVAVRLSGVKLNIPGLSPKYLPSAPTIPDDGIGGYYAYLWSALGVDYKITRVVPVGASLPSNESSHPSIDPNRSTRAWGIWSEGGATL